MRAIFGLVVSNDAVIRPQFLSQRATPRPKYFAPRGSLDTPRPVPVARLGRSADRAAPDAASQVSLLLGSRGRGAEQRVERRDLHESAAAFQAEVFRVN